MKDLFELYDSMPQKDCGACGNSTCRTMARRMSVGEQQLGECFYLRTEEFKEHRKCIEEILREGVVMQKTEPKKTGMTLVTPCIVDAKKFQAEVYLKTMESRYEIIDPFLLCSFLENYEKFEEIKCSPKLGVARINFGQKEILASLNGRLVIRLAKDKDDALETADIVSRVVWGSMICPSCGNPVVECASGGYSIHGSCPFLGDLPFPGKPVKSSIPDTLDVLERDSTFVECISSIKQLYKVFEVNFSHMWNKKTIDMSKAEEIKKKSQKDALTFLIETERENALLGLVLWGTAQHLSIMNRAVKDAREYFSLEVEFREEVENFVKAAFDSFEKTFQNAEASDTEYKRIGKKLLQSNIFSLELFRLLSNAYYISRGLCKRVKGSN